MVRHLGRIYDCGGAAGRGRGRARPATGSRRGSAPARAPPAAAPAPVAPPPRPRPRAPRAPGRPTSTASAPSASADHDVRPPPQPAVDQDRAPAVDGLDDLGQGVGGRGNAVELATAVVGDDDAGGAVLDGERRVLGREHALDQDRNRALRGQRSTAFQSSAGSTWAKTSWTVTGRWPPIAASRLGTVTSAGTAKPVRRSRSRRPARGASTVSSDRLEARVDRLLEQRPGDPLVAEAVELEPAPSPGRRRGDLARPRGGDRREAHQRPRRRGGARHPLLAVGMREALEGHRRHQHRHRNLCAEQLASPWSPRSTSTSTRGRSRQPPPGGDVLAQRHLVARPAGEIAPACPASSPPPRLARSRRR